MTREATCVWEDPCRGLTCPHNHHCVLKGDYAGPSWKLTPKCVVNTGLGGCHPEGTKLDGRRMMYTACPARLDGTTSPWKAQQCQARLIHEECACRDGWGGKDGKCSVKGGPAWGGIKLDGDSWKTYGNYDFMGTCSEMDYHLANDKHKPQWENRGLKVSWLRAQLVDNNGLRAPSGGLCSDNGVLQPRTDAAFAKTNKCVAPNTVRAVRRFTTCKNRIYINKPGSKRGCNAVLCETECECKPGWGGRKCEVWNGKKWAPVLSGSADMGESCFSSGGDCSDLSSQLTDLGWEERGAKELMDQIKEKRGSHTNSWEEKAFKDKRFVCGYNDWVVHGQTMGEGKSL